MAHEVLHLSHSLFKVSFRYPAEQPVAHVLLSLNKKYDGAQEVQSYIVGPSHTVQASLHFVHSLLS